MEMMDVNKIYCGNHIAIYVNHIIVSYTSIKQGVGVGKEGKKFEQKSF